MTTPQEDSDSACSLGSLSCSRRQWISTAVGSLGLLSGCLSGDSLGGSLSGAPAGVPREEIPDFSVDDEAQPTPLVLASALLDAPEEIHFRDPITVQLVVGNSGGSAITAQSIDVGLSYADENSNSFIQRVRSPPPKSVSLPEIPSGEYARVEVELRANAGGPWEIDPDAELHPSYSHQFDVAAKSLSVGDSVSTEIGSFEVTALEPIFERALHYQTEEGGVGLFNEPATGLLSAAPEKVLVLHRFEITNMNQSQSLGFSGGIGDTSFTNATATASTGSVIGSGAIRDSISSLQLGDAGQPFSSTTIAGGESSTAVVIQEVSIEEIQEATIDISLWGGTRDIRLDTIQDSPQLPAFELVDVTVGTNGDGPAVMEVTVENVGESAGTFRGAGQFYYERFTATNWVYLNDSIELALDPGQQATGSIRADRGSSSYRILPFEEEIEI